MRSRQSPVESIGCVILLIGLLGVIPSPSFAQQSRAEDIARQQAEKSTRLTPNTPSLPERTIDWVEDHFTDPNTVYLTFGGVYPSGGLAPGVGLRHAFGRGRLDLGGAYSVRGYKLARASFGFPHLAGDRLELEARARWTDATQVPFYGIGEGSLSDDRVSYGLRAVEAGGRLAFKPAPWYRIGGAVELRNIDTREGTGTRPSIEARHSPLTAPGLLSEARYTQMTAFTAIDWRESPGYTRRGGLYSIAFNDFRDRGDRFGFSRVDAEVRQYLPLLKEHWVLAFRGLVQTTTPEAGQVIPYFMLPSLGGADTHRGYADFRFRDRHLLLLSGEYRWLPSRVLDMAIFVDAGKVAADRGDLDLDGLEVAYGIGARFHGPSTTPFRIDVARGREGFRVHVSGGLMF